MEAKWKRTEAAGASLEAELVFSQTAGGQPLRKQDRV